MQATRLHITRLQTTRFPATRSVVRHSAHVFAIAALLSLAAVASEAQQNQPTPPAAGSLGPKVAPAPVGHRQPRAADIKPTEKSAAEIQEERAQADLERKLKICRGC